MRGFFHFRNSTSCSRVYVTGHNTQATSLAEQYFSQTRASMPELTNAHHDQYFALSGSTQRTPPRGSSLSPR